ncbi:MAG: glycosyltransferase, partial [Planctomycetes bacterium]|nr:glycosyltransferase [Planctomycetota bacterium]
QELQQEHAATFGALQHTTGELAAERNSHADTANRLTATTDALAQRESELAQRTADLAQRTADLAQRSDELAHSKRAIAGLEAIRRRQEEQRRQRERVLGQTIRRRTAAQYLLANEIAQQRLAVEAQRRTSLRLRGMRIQAGATTLEFARRFATWRRKLGTLLGTRPPGLPRSRHAPPVIATAMAAAAERAELAALAAEAAAAALPIVLRDGNSATAAALPEVPAGSFGTWTFPERAARHWRIFARRHPGRCEPLLQSLAEALGGDTAGAIAAMGPALAFARTARTARTALLIAGSDPIEQFRIAVAARLLELPWVAVVAQLAATDEPTANWTRRELGTAALLIARSAGLQQTLVGTGIDAERIVVRPGPIVPAAAPTAAGEGRPRLLVCGRMAAGIGWESLLAAISVLCDRGWHLRLDVLAEVDPTAVDSLSAAAVFRANLPTLDVSANVELVHAATAVQIEQLLAGGPAVFVAPWQPRAAAATALDTGVLAAMSAGLPIVATDVPAIAAAVADGREALLVPPGDERALTDATGRLLREPGLRAELGARARERFFAEFAPELSRATLGERLRRLLPPGSRT